MESGNDGVDIILCVVVVIGVRRTGRRSIIYNVIADNRILTSKTSEDSSDFNITSFARSPKYSTTTICLSGCESAHATSFFRLRKDEGCRFASSFVLVAARGEQETSLSDREGRKAHVEGIRRSVATLDSGSCKTRENGNKAVEFLNGAVIKLLMMLLLS